MSKLQDRYNDLAARRDKLAGELAGIAPKLEGLRSAAADALLADEPTEKQEREIGKLTARAEVLTAAIARAKTDLDQLAGQIAEEKKSLALAEYARLDQLAQEKLEPLAGALLALEAARADFAGVILDMAAIARPFQSSDAFRSRLANMSGFLKSNVFECLMQYRAVFPEYLEAWQPQQPHNPASMPDQPRKVEYYTLAIPAGATPPEHPIVISKLID